MVEKAKTLILGAKGMLGHDLCSVFPYAVQWGHEELDITDKDCVFKKIINLKPSLVINAAAYTRVDDAESNKELAFKVNADAVGYIAKACNTINADLIHFSTDYVFDGKKRGYAEDDMKNPLNTYGASKSKGEDLLMAGTKRYYLIRTSWLFGRHGNNFVETVLRLAKEREKITIVDDQIGSPTYTKDLAEKIKELLGKPYGIYHITNDGICSWFEFAKEIIKLKNLNVEVVPIKSSQLKRAALRPRCSILLNNKLSKMRYWKDALNEYFRVIA
jgi:dTDP-4-dehydrorhamnose reductase